MGWTFDEMLAEEQSKKARKRQTHHEDNLEASCVRWWDIQHRDKQLLLHHSPNEGKRSNREGGRNRTLGTRKGFPDLILLISQQYYDYLAIELKTQTGRLTDEQKEYQKVVNETGGCYIIIRELVDFVDAVEDYLAGKEMTKWQEQK